MAATPVSAEGALAAQFKRKQRHPALDVTIRVAKNPVGAVFGGMIVILIIMAITAYWITPYDPLQTSIETFRSPNWTHPFGTDDIGRDQYTRVIYGSRPALTVGILSVFLGVGTGSLIGLVSGFFGGKLDLILQRFVDGVVALPALVLILALVSVLGPSLRNAVIAIAVVSAANVSRVIRGAVISLKQNIYIEAAKTLGATNIRIMLRHVLPNVVAPILILISSSMGSAVLLDASLSFLGLGTQPPAPSWGLMLATSGRRYMETAPYLAIIPGIFISMTVLAFNMVGDTVRDILDPRLRGSR
ncbi:MAG: ABC transporter permease [Dehalococcoidia bacterium]|nr:ABC transporter permease [Dehalococcoidia bacterium]